MDVFESTNSFQFYDDLAVNEKIEAMFADLVISVEKSYRLLADKLNPAQRKLDSERLLINGLEEAWPKFAVNLDCRCDNAVSGLTISQIPSYFPAFLIHF